ncbi:MAG: helix-turn-helix domain-containing protein [Clostridia bacterium]|nr:helix-turn-helix domain-containing protein [Clostridia bacterium]
MTVGERIKARRQELGLSVDEVAKRLNKNRATIYRYESDEIENLSITILEPIAKVLCTTPGYLMGWEDAVKEDSESIDSLKHEEIRSIARAGEKMTHEQAMKLKQVAEVMFPELFKKDTK